MITLKEKKQYITGLFGSFVKFSNTEDFLELSVEVRDFLKNEGIYSYRKGYPYLTTDGVLKKYNDNLIIIGTGNIGQPFCIDTATNQIVGIDIDTHEIYIINTSIHQYINTLYTLYKFSEEIEGKEVLGEYWANHKKYAKKLQEILELVEPNIMQYEIWAVQVIERDLGVI